MGDLDCDADSEPSYVHMYFDAELYLSQIFHFYSD